MYQYDNSRNHVSERRKAGKAQTQAKNVKSDTPHIYIPVVQRVVIGGTLQDIYNAYFSSEHRRFLGSEEDYFVIRIISKIWDKYNGGGTAYIINMLYQNIDLLLKQLVEMHRLLGEADLSISVFELLWKSVKEGLLDKLWNIRDISLLKDYIGKYIEAVEELDKMVQNSVPAGDAEAKKLLSEQAIKRAIEKYPPLSGTIENIVSNFKNFSGEYLGGLKADYTIFSEDGKKVVYSLFSEEMSPILQRYLLQVMTDYKGEKCLLEIVAYLTNFFKIMEAPALELGIYAGTAMEEVMDYAIETVRHAVNNDCFESSIEQEISRCTEYLSNIKKVVLYCRGYMEQNGNALSDEKVNILICEMFARSEPGMPYETLLEIAADLIGLRSEAAVSEFNSAGTFYNEIRKLAYTEIYHLSGMDSAGEAAEKEPAYLHKAFFHPFAAFRRNMIENVPYPSYSQLKGSSQIRKETVFDKYKATQDNTGGAFVRGKGAGSYFALFKNLKKSVVEEGLDLTDAQIAEDILNIFEGRKSQLLASEKCAPIISKIMMLFCYAEARRHPVALLEAYTALKKYKEDALAVEASSDETARKNFPDITAVFNANKPNLKYTPLFVPVGGAKMIQGEGIDKRNMNKYQKLLVEAAKRMDKYFSNESQVQSCMAEIVKNLLPFTNAQMLYQLAPEMIAGFSRVRESGGSQVEERFQYQTVSGEGNNCAFNSIATILKHEYNIDVGSPEHFAERMRFYAGIEGGTMVELIEDGERILNALRMYFLIELGWNAETIPDFVLHAVINFAGEPVDMQNVAHTSYQTAAPRPVPVIELNLLFNGINHFDALISNLPDLQHGI